MKTRTKKVARHRVKQASGDARLRALTEHALEIITVQDATGRFTYVNEAVVRHLGYPVHELLGRNAIDFLHPDDIAGMRERFRNVLATKDNQPERNRFEYRFRRRDGSWCWLESVAVNALANATVLGIIAHSRDITRRKANEHSLSLNNARYRTVADLSAGAVHEYIMNAQGVYELEWSVWHRAHLWLRRRRVPSPRLAELPRQRRLGGSQSRTHAALPCRRDGRIHRTHSQDRRRNSLDRGQESTHRRSGQRQVHTPRGRRGRHH